MLEQQLVDYIKKAREGGQTDDQSQALLYKNGWTKAEVDEALLSLNQPMAQPQPQSQPQPQAQPVVKATPQYATQPAAMENLPRMRRSSHSLLKMFLVMIAVIVLAGIGWFVAAQYFNFTWNPFTPTPKTVIDGMITNMKNVKTYHVVMQDNLNVTNKSSSSSQGELKINANGDADVTDPANTKSNATFDIQLTAPTTPLGTMSANASVVGLGVTSYFKINNITVPNTFSYPGLDTTQITGKWMKIDQDTLTALSQADNSIPATNSLALVKKIQDLFFAENLFADAKSAGSETISGHNTYHFVITISKEKIKDLLGKIIDLEMPTSDASTSDAAKSFANSFAEAVGNVDIGLWIGKTDYMLYQVKIDKIVDLSKFSALITAQIEAKINVVYSDFNKTVVITEPTGAQKIEEIILPLLKPQKINSDLIGLSTIASALGEDYSSLCTRGLLNGYLETFGTHLVDLNNDIISQGGKRPFCLSSVSDYCISTQLTDGSYLCIDKNGVVGTTRCTSAQTVCNGATPDGIR